MAKNPVLGLAMNLCIFILFACFSVLCSYCEQRSSGDFFTYSSFSIPPTKLKHYDWRYIRVDLPPWFFTISIALESDVNLDQGSIDKCPKSKLPIICFRDGSLPLPDVSDAALQGLVLNRFVNGSAGGIQYLQNVEQCYPLQKKITLTLNYGQIMSGVLYVGLFNGIGPIRTQSKMINRGLAYSFSANVTVEACADLTMWGQYCNQRVDSLSCPQSDLDKDKLQQNYLDEEVYDQMTGSKVACRNSLGASCHRNMEPKFYSLHVMEMVDQMMITAAGIRFDQAPFINNTWDSNGIILMCYARYGALPANTVYDYSVDLSNASMIIQSPKVGTWYFAIQPISQLNVYGGKQDNKKNICYSMKWQLLGCPQGKAGPNCTWEKYMLQKFQRENPTVPFVYLPAHEDMPLESPNFPLEALLSKSSYGNTTDVAWTYFLLDVPDGEAGKNIHIQLISKTTISYEVYARFSGLPSLDVWDYSYSNQTSKSNRDFMFKLYDSVDGKFNFYIFYAREGPWSIGLRHPAYMGSPSSLQTKMSVSIKSCPNRCCGHGTCWYHEEASGSSDYSYCLCDRTHGGFDCSVETVSQEGQRWHSISLIASNAAAILPAFWALRQKAFADWVIFISSGLSSGLYHACDVGIGCILPFHVLQFMDFWLSFMAVVSTFVYLTTISEAAKRTIHTIVLILTALMAATGATRSRNIVLVMAMGVLGLLVGWLIEFCTAYKSYSFSTESCFHVFQKWPNVRVWLPNVMKALYRRFRWRFLVMGFVTFSIAALSWKLEATQSYWIWHSIWHVSIYTSSFFFLCSKRATLTTDGRVESHTTSEST